MTARVNEQVQAYLARYPQDVAALFTALRAMIYACGAGEITESLWARLPTYAAGSSFVRLIPFRDHINIEARAAADWRARLPGYRFTPKGMLQIDAGQSVPREALLQIFRETLGRGAPGA